jgi:hypothetical protein
MPGIAWLSTQLLHIHMPLPLLLYAWLSGFLSTQLLQFEVARCRPQLTAVGQQRFSLCTLMCRFLHCCMPGSVCYLFATAQFEVARCRPQLTPEFFKQLDTLVGQERFSPKPDEVGGSNLFLRVIKK